MRVYVISASVMGAPGPYYGTIPETGGVVLFFRTQRIRRSCATLVLATLTSSCTAWREQQGPPNRVVEANRGEMMLVTDTGGRRYTVRDVRIANDSLVGIERTKETQGGYREETRKLALAEVQSVQTRQFSMRRALISTAIVAASVVAVAFVAALVALDDSLDDLNTGGGLSPSLIRGP